MNSMSMKYKFAELITSRHHQGELRTNRRILRSRYNYAGGNYSREIISGGLAILVRMFNMQYRGGPFSGSFTSTTPVGIVSSLLLYKNLMESLALLLELWRPAILSPQINIQTSL